MMSEGGTAWLSMGSMSSKIVVLMINGKEAAPAMPAECIIASASKLQAGAEFIIKFGSVPVVLLCTSASSEGVVDCSAQDLFDLALPLGEGT